MAIESIKWGAKKLAVLCLAYGVGALAAALAIDPQSILAGDWTISTYLQLSGLIAIFAAPGFVVLRSALIWFRSRSSVIFALAGAVNGAITQLGFVGDISPEFLVSGLAGGLAVWGFERCVTSGPMVRGMSGVADG